MQVTHIFSMLTKVEGDDRFQVDDCIKQTNLFGGQGIELIANGEDVGALFIQ